MGLVSLSPAQSAVLRLQRQAGNSAVAAMIAPRPTVPTVARVPVAAMKPPADIDRLTLGQFHQYARDRPDWSTDPALIAARRRSLFTTLEFARAGTPAPVGPCGDMPLTDVEAAAANPTERELLRVFSRGRVAADTGAIPATAVVADARRDGEALKKLEAAIPRATLHLIMGTADAGKAEFPRLVSAGEIDNFAAYIRASRASLEAENGADVASYLEMVTTDGVNPGSFVGRLPHVRNYHRFLAPMLTTLISNEADTSRAKPLLLILHTGSDHNGAFHRDVEFQNLVQHPRNLSIMIEGAATLDAAGAEVRRIARRQAPRNRIQQIMIAGHGSPRSMDLAGTPDASGHVSGRESLDLDRNRVRTERFLRGLVANMERGPDARIVLNACLTAADEVSRTLSADPVRARSQILGSLRRSPSLAARLQQLAPGRSVEGNVSSVPAGEYMAVDALGRPTGVLHQIIPSDPLATGSDRAAYIENGVEPEGCMRAVVALWALNRTECLARVRARRARAIGGWADRVVHTLYDIVDAQPDNAALMNRIANSAAGGLSEFDAVEEQTPPNVGGLNNAFSSAEASSILTPLYPLLPATGKLAVDQVWMIKTTARRTDFMTGLAGFASIKDAEPHLDADWLAPSLAALLPVASAAAPTKAQMMLAIYTRDSAGGSAFLKANAGTRRAFTMPSGTTIAGLSGGDLTDDGLLGELGLLGSAPSGSGLAAPTPNLDLDGDGVADIYIESLARQARVTVARARVISRPDRSGAIIDTLRTGRAVDVIGETGPWFAVDLAGRVGFLRKGLVRRLPVG